MVVYTTSGGNQRTHTAIQPNAIPFMLKRRGVVFIAGAGCLFSIDSWPLNLLREQMVKAKRTSPNQDVALDSKIKLVMEMELFKVGKSKYKSVRLLAQSTAGVSPSCAHNYVRKFRAGGLSNLTPKRTGNRNASKFSPTKAEKIKEVIAEDRGATCRELAAQLGSVTPPTANAYRSKLGFKPRIARKTVKLTASHMRDRLAYCDANVDEDYKNVVMTDEKWFYLDAKGQVIRYYTDAELTANSEFKICEFECSLVFNGGSKTHVFNTYSRTAKLLAIA